MRQRSTSSTRSAAASRLTRVSNRAASAIPSLPSRLATSLSQAHGSVCFGDAPMPPRKKSSLPPSRPEVIAFLRDIKDDPDDDTPRLILADWLEDRYDPRGQFVRLQVEAALSPEHDPRREELTQEAEDIRNQHEEQWLG